MDRGKYAKKSKSSHRAIMYRTVGILFVLTMLSMWLLSGLFAKYVVSDSASDSARVASGLAEIVLKEHKAELKSGVYELDEDEEVTENEYSEVIPGVDIPKDPFIQVDLEDSEVSYELYVMVTESDPFPEKVTYDLTDNWKYVRTEGDADIYQYVTDEKKPFIFEPGKTYKDIKILKDDKLYVSEHYVGDIKNFSLKFKAYLMQTKTN